MLQNIIKFLKKDFRWLLVLIISVAVFLRFWGADPGYPPYHPDEGVGYSSAVGMIKEGNLDPGGPGYPVGYGYPSVVPLANFLLFKFFFIPVKWTGFYLSHAGQIIDGFLHLPLTQEEYKRIFQLEILGVREVNALIWGRYVTALFGVGVVFLTYLLGSKFFNRRAGLVVSFLVAVNYRQVLNSHIGLPDIYNAFFLLLALLLIGNLLQSPTKKNYLLAGLSTALYFSTKFQVFAFLPFLIAHIAVSWKKRKLVHPDFFLGAALIPLITLLLNPYHIIHWEKFRDIQTYQLLKYGIGTWQISVFPFSYLFHIGLGAAISVLAIVGVVWGLKKHALPTIILLTVILQFFFIFTFYTRGGFYTRNFVTITPLFLVFAGFALERLTSFLKPKSVGVTAAVAAVILVSWTNISNSVTSSRAYAQPWNFQVLSGWLAKNIPAGSRVSAHSSVPLPIESVERLPFDFSTPFSLEEFREDGADYAIANLDWATNEFYWWMTRDTQESLRFWNKPVNVLEYTYAAMALRELSDFALFTALNPWQAPESNFIAAKIPQYKVSLKELSQTFVFDESEGWKSPPIDVSLWQGVIVEGKLKTETAKEQVRTGYISASFYSSFEDAELSRNRIGVRLTSRVREPNTWQAREVVTELPLGAKYMIVAFDSYNPVEGKTIAQSISIYKAEVELLDAEMFKPVKIDADVLFPFSQGGL